MLDFRGIESPPMNNLVLRVVFISISRAEYILVEASFRNIGERPRDISNGDRSGISCCMTTWRLLLTSASFRLLLLLRLLPFTTNKHIEKAFHACFAGVSAPWRLE